MSDRYRYSYEDGRTDGFIAGCIISMPHNTGGHTLGYYKSVAAYYRKCTLDTSSIYEKGYAMGIDCASVYLGYDRGEK